MTALLAMEAVGTPAGWWGTCKMLTYGIFQAAIPVERGALQSRLARWKSPGGAAVPIRSITSTTRLLRRAAGTGKARLFASGQLSELPLRARMKKCGNCPSSQPEAVRTNPGGRDLLGTLSADAAIACMQTLAGQCETTDTEYQEEAGVIKDDSAAAVLAESARNSLEARARQKASTFAKAWECRNVNLVAKEREVVGEGLSRDQNQGIMNETEKEEKICAARVLLQMCMKNKDALSGQSLLELLNAMLSLRLHGLEILAELADTIRRRLPLHVLPSDGLAAIVCTCCFLCNASQKQSVKTAGVSHHVRCFSHVPAPIEELISHAFTELCLRVGRHHQADGSALRDMKTSQAEACSAIPFLVNRRCHTLPSGHGSQLNAADGEEIADVVFSECTDTDIRGKHNTQRSPRKLSSHISVAEYPQNHLSHAGVVLCAWALSRVPFFGKPVFLRHLEEHLMSKPSYTGGSLACLPRMSPTRSNNSAWKQELSRLRVWGVTAAAFVHLPQGHSSRAALAAQNEVVKALTNLRLAILQERSKLINPRHVGSVDALLLHEQMPSSSAQAYVPIKKAFSLEEVLEEGLQKAARSPSSGNPTLVGQAESLTTEEARKGQAAMICAADAATICGAATSVLRLSAVHQHDSAPILEMLYVLHHEDPFMFLVPANELCCFLAAAQEGPERGLDATDESRTLAANTEPVTAWRSPRTVPASHPVHKNEFSQLPASLLWPLLLLPHITTAGEGLLEFMPPRIVALLLKMLSFLPGRLATCRHTNIPLHFACNVLVGDERAQKADTKGYCFSRQRKDVPLPVTQKSPEIPTCSCSGQQHTSSSPAKKELDVQVFVHFEEILRKFSSDLCRIVVQRTAYFGERDIVRSISAIKRLDGDARELPLSGQTWLQHPDFSRVLDCLVRALRRWRQRAEQRHQRCLPHTRGGHQSTPRKSETISTVDASAQCDADSSGAASGTEQSRKLVQCLFEFAAAKNGPSGPQALSTSAQSDELLVEGRGHETEAFGAFSIPACAGDTEGETQVLHLVNCILRPCFSEQNLDNVDLDHRLGSTERKNGLIESSGKSSITQPHGNDTRFVPRRSSSLLFEKRAEGACRDAVERGNAGSVEILKKSPKQNRHMTKAFCRFVRVDPKSAFYDHKPRDRYAGEKRERLQRVAQRARRKEDADDKMARFRRA